MEQDQQQPIRSKYDERTVPAGHDAPTAHGPSLPPPGQMVPGVVYIAPDKAKVQRRRRLNTTLMGCTVLLGSLLLSLVCGGVVIVAAVLNSFGEQIVGRLEEVLPETQNVFQTTRIFDRMGNELWQLIGEGRRTKVKLADISKYVIDGTIAVEDATFYTNPGADLGAIARAGLQYFIGNESGGASTITQQLVRNIAFEIEYRAERSPRRKIEEIAMALALTQRKSKDEILEMYLNLIYYGNLAYGIEAASQTYFGKSARDLTLGEAALLVGLPQSPARLDPLDPDPLGQEAVLTRRKVVLDLMVERGKITRQEANAAQAQPLVYANPNIKLQSPHFTLYAEQELNALLPAINLPPAYVNVGGLSVYTTLDASAQSLAEQVAKQQIDAIRDKNNANNAAIVVLKPGTGEILAMVGSVDYNNDAIDGRVNVTTAPRQPGSSIKPLTYAAAMEKGLSAASVFWDVETHIGTPGNMYSPRNYDRQFHGPVRARDALANSYNIPAVNALRSLGVENLLSFAQRLGIRSLGADASRYGLSLTLGGGEVTPLELAQAYSVLANGGNLVQATAILCIVNGEGQVVYQYENGCAGRGNITDQTITATASPRPVLDPRIAFVISDILADNAARTPAMGARSPLRTDGLVSSVKTGTTDNFRDNWTMGYTHNVVVGVWVGNTDNTEMRNTTGLTGAAPIWNGIITGIYNNPKILESLKINGALRPDELTPPPGLSKQQICDLRSVIDPAPDCQMSDSEWLLDSPPLAPDAQGNLAPSADAQFGPMEPSTNGPLIEPLDPGVTRALVRPLDPALAAVFTSQAINPSGQTMPPPRYCLVPQEVKDSVPGVTFQAFINAPEFPDDDVYAQMYAQSTGLAIMPPLACNQDMLVAGPGVTGLTAVIAAPRPGDTVTGTVNVVGTAAWQAGQAWYFKMEIRGPQFENWTTFSGPFEQPVINGPLGSFGAGGLQPGTYELRIAIIGTDGNYLYESPPSPVNITGQ